MRATKAGDSTAASITRQGQGCHGRTSSPTERSTRTQTKGPDKRLPYRSPSQNGDEKKSTPGKARNASDSCSVSQDLQKIELHQKIEVVEVANGELVSKVRRVKRPSHKEMPNRHQATCIRRLQSASLTPPQPQSKTASQCIQRSK